jgi:pimeloyl-ACP methyl ester carboxylesterase
MTHSSNSSQSGTRYRNVKIGSATIFYREAGDPLHPTLLLLHGFPTSSHMFRNLIPLLADRYHVVAPDLPGFGFTVAPDRQHFAYKFDNLAKVIEDFTVAIRLKQYAIYVFDYGAPVGFRLAVSRPEKVTAIISQNGNAYEEGLSGGWSPIQRYWQDDASKPQGAALVPHPGRNEVAVHPWGRRSGRGRAGVLHAGQRAALPPRQR